jgi:hypothetical protein
LGTAVRRRDGRLIVAIVVMALVLAVGFAAWRCWDGLYVQPGEARAALLRLPYELRFRRIPTPDGLNAVIAGSARAEDGTTVNFAVLLGSARDNTRELPVVAGTSIPRLSGLANATVIVDTPRVTGESWNPSEIDMELAIEDAIFDQAPLRPREG